MSTRENRQSDSPMKSLRQWIALGISLVALTVSAKAFSDARESASISKRIEVSHLLRMAWDELGGKPGTDIIPENRWTSDRSRIEEARRLIEDALAHDPGHPRDGAHKTYYLDGEHSEAHRHKAYYMYVRDLTDRAIEEYEEALRFNPKNHRAYNGLGACAQRNEDFAAALFNFRKAIQVAPFSPLGYLNEGGIHFIENRFQEAIESFERAIDVDPRNVYAFTDLGITLLATGELREAEKNFTKAVDLDPEYGLAYTGLGDVCVKQGEFEKAIWAFERAHNLQPDDDQLARAFSDALKNAGRLKEAERMKEIALLLEKNREFLEKLETDETVQRQAGP